jgi:hypothetical protein
VFEHLLTQREVAYGARVGTRGHRAPRM